jgi:hypothetical protein
MLIKINKKILIFTLFIVLLLSFSFISASTLKVTEEHPFLIKGKWISANQLQIGDNLTTIDGKKVRITNITGVETKEPFPVYNLEAGEYPDFVVCGENNCSNNSFGVVVHNSNWPPPTRPLKIIPQVSMSAPEPDIKCLIFALDGYWKKGSPIAQYSSRWFFSDCQSNN